MCDFLKTKKKSCNLTSVKIAKKEIREEKRLKKEARLDALRQRELYKKERRLNFA